MVRPKIVVGVLCLVVFALAYAALPLVTEPLLAQESRAHCPEMPVRTRSIDVHLSPGLEEHQSWVEFPVPMSFAGWYAFCLDGRLVESGSGVLDFHTGTARFNIPTHWVDLTWLSHTLNDLRDPYRWELRLLCAPDWSCR